MLYAECVFYYRENVTFITLSNSHNRMTLEVTKCSVLYGKILWRSPGV